MMTFIWLGALIIFTGIEIATIGLASIWFAIGALAAFIAALLNAPLWLQIALFIIVSTATLIATRPFARRFLNSHRMATNADRVLSMVGVVKESVDNLSASGVVTVGGRDWTARSLTGQPIPCGTSVRPVNIEGVKLIVVPITDDETESRQSNVEI